MIGALALTVLAAVSAAHVPPALQQQPHPLVQIWLTCDECTQEQLDAVVAAGDAAVPSLRDALLNGPPAAARSELRAHLIAVYPTLDQSWLPDPSEALDLNEFVALYVGNMVAGYQIRAAQALEAIATPAAATALRQALGQPHRDDVERQIRESLTALGF